jgi:hypothetical protein
MLAQPILTQLIGRVVEHALTRPALNVEQYERRLKDVRGAREGVPEVT